MRSFLLKCLRQFWRRSQLNINKKWMRTLSFGDYVVDRWDKAKTLGFGNGTSIYDSSLVYGDVKVGERTWIGPFTILDGSGGLSIGHNCSISAGVHIYTHDTVEWALSGGEKQYERAPVKIGSNCYIGPHAIIAKGVTIGNGCVVGAYSLVSIDMPDNTKAFGVPAQVRPIE